MPEFNLYEFARDLSIVGWIVVVAVMVALIYVISKGTEALVTKKCPWCGKRVPRRAVSCKFCKREGI